LEEDIAQTRGLEYYLAFFHVVASVQILPQIRTTKINIFGILY